MAGLVDDLAYEDEIDDKVQLGRGRVNTLNQHEYRNVAAHSLGLNRGPRIAVIYAVGRKYSTMPASSEANRNPT